MLVTTVATQVDLFPALFALSVLSVVWALSLVGLILTLQKRRTRPPGSMTVNLVVLAVSLACASAMLGYGAIQVYESQSTWAFSYGVSITANGTYPESVILPIPHDENLLAGLHLTSGTANWSLVDTPKGRGLYIGFAGSGSLRVDVTLFPAPNPVPNVGPTMELPYVASLSEYQWWIYYSGQAGGVLNLSLGCYTLHTYLVSGWNPAEPQCPNPPLPPLA